MNILNVVLKIFHNIIYFNTNKVAETVEIYGVENSMGTGEATYIQETLEDESTLEEGTSHPSSSECGTSNLEITCTICNGKFKEKRYLKTHMRLKHSEDPSVASKAKQVSKEKSYNRLCTICKSYFNSRNIISHLRSMHPDVSLGFSCDLCQSTFANDWLLKRHIGNVHKKDRLYRCEICDFSAKRKEHLEEHMIVHNQVTLICDLCDFKTLRICDFCDHKSVSKDVLRMHIKVSFCNIRSFNYGLLIILGQFPMVSQPIRLNLVDWFRGVRHT
jgi:hypothetical protein